MSKEVTTLTRQRKPPASLAVLRKRVSALTSDSSVAEVKEAADLASTVRDHLRKAGASLAIQNEAAEFHLRCVRRIGELLAMMEKQAGARDGKRGSTMEPRTLAELGIEKHQSHRWQRLAALDERLFEDFIETSLSDGRELTAAGALKLAKLHAEIAAKEAREREPLSYGFVEDLAKLVGVGAKFSTVYADPPWQYSNSGTRSSVGGKKGKYKSTMSLDEICAEPVAQIVADNAHLHLWTTNAFLFDAKRVMEAWGFNYKSCFVWVKPQMGIGNYWRVSHEFMLFGIRGNLPFADRGQMSWIQVERTKHSRKPRQVREMIEKVSPQPYLELYGREKMPPPWTVYGNESDESMFDNESQ